VNRTCIAAEAAMHVHCILLYSGVGLAIFSMLTVSAVYVLRRRRLDLPRPFRTPGYPIVPAVYFTGTGLIALADESGRSQGQRHADNQRSPRAGIRLGSRAGITRLLHQKRRRPRNRKPNDHRILVSTVAVGTGAIAK
jgi:hypothetical protein